MSDPIVALFKDDPNLDEIILRRDQSGWGVSRIRYVVPLHSGGKHTYIFRNGRWHASSTDADGKTSSDYVDECADFNERKISQLISQAVEDTVREINRHPTQEDLTKIDKITHTVVHAASPMHLREIQYSYLDRDNQNNPVEHFLHRAYRVLPHITFSITLIPLPRSYKATEPLARGQSLSQFGNSQE